MFTQHQVIELIKDINPVIKKGMIGVILEICNENAFEVEFVKEDATNYGYDGKFTFTVSTDMIK